jgi:hypothetical protein
VALIPRGHGVKNAEHPQTGTLSSPTPHRYADPPAAATELPGQAAEVAASPSPPSSVGSTEAPAAKVQTKRAVGVPTAGRAPAAPVRPAPRPSTTAKSRAPDDGRDELYVPEAR